MRDESGSPSGFQPDASRFQAVRPLISASHPLGADWRTMSHTQAGVSSQRVEVDALAFWLEADSRAPPAAFPLLVVGAIRLAAEADRHLREHHCSDRPSLLGEKALKCKTPKNIDSPASV